jgi:2-polyprenyl-3-methyl-5-hydroxy-6-metoxy-1,4-benzoquinol methylase
LIHSCIAHVAIQKEINTTTTTMMGEQKVPPMTVGVGVNGAKLRRFEVVVRDLLQQNDLSPPCFYQMISPPPQPANHDDNGGSNSSSSSSKATRKRQQVESMLDCIDLFLQDGHTVVDFGGGSGHLCIPLALRHPQVTVLCVDLKAESLEILHASSSSSSNGGRQNEWD